MQTW
jgi:hypothetical protein